jgi:hypothetical protein
MVQYSKMQMEGRSGGAILGREVGKQALTPRSEV